MAKTGSHFLALLRGINVGGRNLISKQDLTRCFGDLGFSDVQTYIQSGNILFQSERRSVRQLTKTIEAELSSRFSYEARACVLSRRDFQKAVSAAPDGWGADASQKHYAMFILSTTTPERVLAQLPAPRPDIETVTIGPGVIFWSASKALQSRATVMKISSSSVYQEMTVRNQNTVFRLLQMFRDAS